MKTKLIVSCMEINSKMLPIITAHYDPHHNTFDCHILHVEIQNSLKHCHSLDISVHSS